MPLTAKGKKILSAMTKEYGTKKGKKVFYSSSNKGTITGVHSKRGGNKGGHKGKHKADTSSGFMGLGKVQWG